MYILGVLGALVRHHKGGETLSISAGEDCCCVPEWCSLSSLGPPHHITREELIGSYHIFQVTIWIKSNIAAIPHLRWTRLDFLQVVCHFFYHSWKSCFCRLIWLRWRKRHRILNVLYFKKRLKDILVFQVPVHCSYIVENDKSYPSITL